MLYVRTRPESLPCYWAWHRVICSEPEHSAAPSRDQSCRDHINAHVFTHTDTGTLSHKHYTHYTQEALDRGPEIHHKPCITFLSVCPLLHFVPQPAGGGVGHAADNGPISTAWHWTAANGNMFTAAGGRVFSHSHRNRSVARMRSGCREIHWLHLQTVNCILNISVLFCLHILNYYWWIQRL